MRCDVKKHSPKILNWHRCYKDGWNGLIVPAAFQHPAKYSRRLIARIYENLLTERLLKRGDKVVDPFGGVALGALDAMRIGLDWTGVELEEKFFTLGNQNISLWNTRYDQMPRWGTARLLHGDSRKLAEIVGTQHRATVSSPPYANSPLTYAKNGILEDGAKAYKRDYMQGNDANYGGNASNLGNLREGDFSAVITSPVYEGARIGDSSGAANVGHGENYGASSGQLGSMEGGDFAAAVGSPRFEKSLDHSMAATSALRHQIAKANRITNTEFVTAIDAKRAGALIPRYGDTAGNIGNDSGETFWLASRTIVEQVHSVLAARGVAVWVCKDFVRNKERVPFCDQWKQLCEHVGFSHLYTARAWLVEEDGTQLAYDGNHKSLRKSHKSFFRRLNEAKGAPAIDFEQVIFMVKA